MTHKKNGLIGYSCSYTPIQLINAAGYTPFRILPETNAPDQAGQLMHENLCMHVKQILNRGLSNDLPDLDGIVFINSCDAMRRLSSAWKAARPNDNIFVMELPSVINNTSISFFAKELTRFVKTLSDWSNNKITDEEIELSISLYNEIGELFSNLRNHVQNNLLDQGYEKLQELYNLACTSPIEEAIDTATNHLSVNNNSSKINHNIPIYLFGNVLSTKEIFNLFDSCGATIVNDDLCTGSRSIRHIDTDFSTDVLFSISESFLAGPSCARIIDTDDPYRFAGNILSEAQKVNAKGVIGHTLKFCDPYLAHLPVVREVLQKASLPLLMLEGDCTMGSFAQQQTRIEAFIDMLR